MIIYLAHETVASLLCRPPNSQSVQKGLQVLEALMRAVNFVNKVGRQEYVESICTICVRTIRAETGETREQAEARHVCEGFDLKKTLGVAR
jgi:hypothetical protein